MSAAFDYNQRAKTIRAKFFPTPLVRVIRTKTGFQEIYRKPIGPLFQQRSNIRAYLYKRPIGPPRPVVDTAPQEFLSINGTKARDIIEDVCKGRNVTFEALSGESRLKQFVAARGEICYRLRVEAGCSSPQIGRLINRDHSTVIYSSNRHAIKLGLPQP